MSLTRVWRIGFVLLLLAVTYLTVTPNPDVAGPGHALTDLIASLLFGSTAHADKVAHFLAYLGLGGAFVLARPPFFSSRLSSLMILAGYGAFLEIVQGLTASRSPELLDAAANAAGAVASYPLALAFERVLEMIFLKGRSDKNREASEAA